MNLKTTFAKFPLALQFLYLTLIFVGCWMLSGGLSTLACYLIFGQTNLSTPQTLWLFQSLSSLGTFLLPTLWFAQLKEGNQIDYLKTKSPIHFLDVSCAVLLFLVSIPLISYIIEWNKNIHFGAHMQIYETMFRNLSEKSEYIFFLMLQTSSWAGLSICILVMALIPAICEEFFFRGCLQNFFTEWFKNPSIAIFVTALVFSLIHLDLFGFFARFLLGVLLGYIFYYSASIWVSILIHFINNASVVVLFFLFHNQMSNLNPDKFNHSFGLVFTLISLLLSVLLTVFYIRHKRSTKKIVKF
ncbi:MAG: CPBP family intramembrane glutamic endopeptidase [Bacteroidales bacterium]